MVLKSEHLNAPGALWRAVVQIARGPLATAGLRSLIVQVAAIVLGLAQAVILARLLGVTDYGIFATAMSVSTILAAISVGGFDQYAVRELSRLRTDGDLPTALAFIRFGNRAALASTLLASGGLAAVAAAYAGVESEWRNTFILAAAATPFSTILLLRAGQLRGLGAVVVSQVPLAMIRPGAMIVLLGAFWISGITMTAPHGMTAWLLASVTALMLASAVLHWRKRLLDASRPSRSLGRKWLVDTSPFLGSTVVGILSAQVNTLMLAWLAGPEAAGLFQPIAYLAPVIALPLAAFTMPFAPRIVELWAHHSGTLLKRITLQFTALTLLGGLIIGSTALLFGEHILGMFGQRFITGTSGLGWVVAAQVLHLALGPAGILLSMTDAHRLVLAALVLGLVANVLLAILLIPLYGVDGAAISLAAGIVVGRLVMLAIAVKRFRFDPSIVGALVAAISRIY